MYVVNVNIVSILQTKEFHLVIFLLLFFLQRVSFTWRDANENKERRY